MFKFTPTHLRILEVLDGSGCYIVGGAVRDEVMGRPCHDIDIAVTIPPAELFTKLEKGKLSLAPDNTAKSHGIARVIDRDTGELVDVASTRRDIHTDGRHAVVEFTTDILEDLARRDLTINAMAYRVGVGGKIGNLIDPYGGMKDISTKRISLVGDPNARIIEDRLRMMRVARFATLLTGSKISFGTEAACRKYASQISGVSKERIRDEIVKALTYPKAGWMFRHLHNLGLLQYVMPDLARGIGSKQDGRYHTDDVFEHLCYCVDRCEGKKYTPLLKLAVLHHDIAKPHTRAEGKDGGVSFYQHEVVGTTITYNWMKEYKFSNQEIQYVTKLVRQHMFRFEDDSTDKTIKKWLQEIGKDTWRDLFRLRIADRKGNRKRAGYPSITLKMKELIHKIRTFIREGHPIFQEDLAINGDDLKKMGLSPGPVYKTIFSNMLGIVQVNPEKNTREWLEGYVQRNYIDPKPQNK